MKKQMIFQLGRRYGKTVEAVDELIKVTEEEQTVVAFGEDFVIMNDKCYNQLLNSIVRLKKALDEALDEWEYCSSYKGDYLCWKHNDEKRIKNSRQILGEGKDEKKK